MRAPSPPGEVARALLVALACLCVALPAAGQTCGADGKYHLRSAPAALNYGPVTIDDLDAGQIVAGTVSITIIPRGKANFDWDLCLRGAMPFFGPGAKPIEAVEWQLGGGGWQQVSSLEQLVASGTGRMDLEVSFRVAVDYDDAPGDYEALLTFAVAQQ